MRKNIIFINVISIFIFILLSYNLVFANEKKIDYGKTNQIIIEDEAKLLSDNEIENLRNSIGKLSEYGNVVFKTSNKPISGSSLKYIQNYYYSLFENDSGVVFYIDLYNRELCACATGGLEDILTNGKCNSIVDNVYKYASSENYYRCALSAYSQMNDLLHGEKIAETMKYISNFFVALMISLFFSFKLFEHLTYEEKLDKYEIKENCITSIKYSSMNLKKVGRHEVYCPVVESNSSISDAFSSSSSDSLFGGRSSSSGRSSSGGGFSGSGGRHRF